MKRLVFAGIIFAVTLAPRPGSTEGRLPVPRSDGMVNDTAEMLSDESRQRLEMFVRAYEERTSNEIGVLTVPSLDGEDLDDYSLRVANEWGVGQVGKNNGVLIFIAKEDRKVRITVGHGLEGYLTNETCGEILKKMLPFFSESDYDGAVFAAVNEVVEVLDQFEWDFNFKTFVGPWTCDAPFDQFKLLIRDTGETSMFVKSVRLDGFSTFKPEWTSVRFGFSGTEKEGEMWFHLRPFPKENRIYFLSNLGQAFTCNPINR